MKEFIYNVLNGFPKTSFEKENVLNHYLNCGELGLIGDNDTVTIYLNDYYVGWIDISPGLKTGSSGCIDRYEWHNQTLPYSLWKKLTERLMILDDTKLNWINWSLV